MNRTPHSRGIGILLCCASALAFGLLGPFGVRAFDLGLSLNTVVGWRFGLAAAVLWVIVVVTRRRIVGGRGLWQPLMMGAVLYAGQTALYFSALQRLPVGLTALLLYTMPVMVVLVSIGLRREPPHTATFIALALSVGGVALALVGPAGGVSVVGVLFGLGSAVVYTGYYFGMDSLPARVDRLVASALVSSGAGVSHVLLGLLRGRFDLTPGPVGLLWIVAMAVVCTVVALSLLMVGIRTAGASTASVVSCLEPISAVLLGAAFFADPFGPAQWVGTATVVAAVVILGTRSPTSPVGATVEPIGPVDCDAPRNAAPRSIDDTGSDERAS